MMAGETKQEDQRPCPRHKQAPPQEHHAPETGAETCPSFGSGEPLETSQAHPTGWRPADPCPRSEFPGPDRRLPHHQGHHCRPRSTGGEIGVRIRDIHIIIQSPESVTREGEGRRSSTGESWGRARPRHSLCRRGRRRGARRRRGRDRGRRARARGEGEGGRGRGEPSPYLTTSYSEKQST